MTDWKARCAELMATLETHYPAETQGQYFAADLCDVLDRIRAELDQPEPQELTKQEAQELFNSIQVPIIEKLTPGSDEEIVCYEPVHPLDLLNGLHRSPALPVPSLPAAAAALLNNDPPR